MWWPRVALGAIKGPRTLRLIRVKKTQECHRAGPCEINSDYCRNSRQRAAPQVNSDGEVKLADGTARDQPAEDQIVLEAPGWPISRRPRHCPEGAAPPIPDNRGDPLAPLILRRPNARAPRKKTKNS